jgi:hypothetical protein
MGSDLVLCKYVLQDGLWDFLTCIPLSCSLQAPMETFLTIKPNVHLPPRLPPSPAVETQELVAAIFFSGVRTTVPGRKRALVHNVAMPAAARLLAMLSPEPNSD